MLNAKQVSGRGGQAVAVTKRWFQRERLPPAQDRSCLNAVEWPTGGERGQLDEEISRLAKKYQPLAVELLKEAIRIPEDHVGQDERCGTSNHEGPRLEYLRQQIVKHKAVARSEDVFFDAFGNLVWEVSGDGGKSAAGKTVVWFDGHTDTVNPLADEWKKLGGGIDVYRGLTDVHSVDVDKLRQQLGYLPPVDELSHCVFGRGSADQLSGVVAQIVATKIMLELKHLGALDGVFIRSHGTVAEEDNDGGGPMYVLRQEIPASGRVDLLPDVVVHTEGTGCEREGPCGIYIGHRGRMQIELTVTGKSSHGSMPHMGLNPLEYGAQIVAQAREQHDNKHGFAYHPFLGSGSRTASWCELHTPSNCAVPARFVVRFDRRLTVGETAEQALQSIESLPAVAEARRRGLDVKLAVPHYRQRTWRGYTADNEELYVGWNTPPQHEAVKSAVDAWQRVVTDRLDGAFGSAHPLTRIPSTPRVGSWVFSTDGVAYPIPKQLPGFPAVPADKHWVETASHRHPAMIGIGIGFEANTHKIGEFIDARHFPAAIALMSRFPSLYNQRKHATDVSLPLSSTSPTTDRQTNSAFTSSDGGVRHYHLWRPASRSAQAVVIVVHGYAEHGGRYAKLAEHLNEHNNALVCAIDLEGHGRSSGERAVLDFDRAVDDVRTLLDIALADSTAADDVPVFVCGHSMGGLLTARFVQRHGEQLRQRLAGACFLGAVLGDWQWIERALATGSPGDAHLPNSTPNLAGMSRSVDSQQQYQLDPLVYHGPVPRRLIERESVALADMRAATARLNLPMLVLHGSDDPFVPYRNTLQAVLDSPAADITLRVYPGARHELVNETNDKEVIADISDFIRRKQQQHQQKN